MGPPTTGPVGGPRAAAFSYEAVNINQSRQHSLRRPARGRHRGLLVTGMLLLWLFALGGNGFAAQLSDEQRQYLAEHGPVICISQTNYPPFEFLGPDGQRVGMSLDLVRWIATTLGFEVRFLDANFQQAQEAVLEGRADLLTSLFFSPQRAQNFGFSPMAFQVPAYIFVAADRPDIKDIQDLEGKNLAMPQGDYAQEFLEGRGIRFKPIWTRDFAQATDLVIAGQADAVIGDEQVVLHHIYSRHLTPRIKRVGDPLYVGMDCLAVKAGNRVLLGILEQGLALAKSTGTLDEINRKWQGQHYKVDESLNRRYWLYLLVAAGALSLLVMLVWMWNLQLRRLARRRTTELARSEATLKAILNASPVGIGLVSQYALGWHNPAMGAILGLEADQNREIELDSLFCDPEHLRLTLAAIGRAQAGQEQTQMDTRWRRADGQEFDCLLRIAPLGQAQERFQAMAIATDISQRKRAEEALRVSEEKHRLVLDESTDPIFSFAPDGTYLYVNKAFAAPFNRTPADIIGRRIWDIFPQDEADKRYAAVKAVFESGQTRVIEVRVPQPVEDLYFVTSVKPVKDEGGRVVMVICISKDISERKRAEEALRESEERFRVINEFSPLGLSLLDHQGNYTYVNPAFVKMFGYTLEEVPSGRVWFRKAFPDAQTRHQVIAEWLEGLKNHPEGEVRPHTYQIRCRDGALKTVLFRPVTITKGRQFVIYEDVTQRLAAEKALTESERRYRELFDNMSDLIYTQDLQGRFLSANPALAKTFGYPPERLLGRKASDFMKPEFREAYRTDYLERLRTQGHYFGLSMYFASDGQRRYIEYHSSLVTPQDGPPYISGVGRDVTERIMAERKLARLQEQLFQSQKIQALGVLAGGIAHDFNNVLQSISGYTQLMLSENQATPSNRERLEHIEQSIARATGMIGHLMTLARKGRTKLERVDLNQEVRRTAKILEHTLPKMIAIRMDLDPQLQPVTADATQVEQVLLNLSTNAGQAMPQGGELTFDTANAYLSAADCQTRPGLKPGAHVRLTVSDNGLGMDEKTLTHIFEPFFTTKPQGQGTGLGLSTVYGIITNSGGHIACQSRPGKGTTFTIHLPAGEPDSGQGDQPTGLRASYVAGSETILIVDDEPSILETGRLALEDFGYLVLTADSGEAALELYLNSPRPIDLVILDLSMPGMGGMRCLEALVQAHPQAKVLVATGYADEAVTRQINELGARDLIGKPYRFQDLLAKVRGLLDS